MSDLERLVIDTAKEVNAPGAALFEEFWEGLKRDRIPRNSIKRLSGEHTVESIATTLTIFRVLTQDWNDDFRDFALIALGLHIARSETKK